MLDHLIKTCILHKNNKTSNIFTKNIKNQSQTKHIDIQYHYVKILINDNKLMIK